MPANAQQKRNCSRWYHRFVGNSDSSLPDQTSKPLSRTQNKSDITLNRGNSSILRYRRKLLEAGSLKSSQCICCGTLLRYPDDVNKIRCMVCQTSYRVSKDGSATLENRSFPGEPITLDILENKLKEVTSSSYESIDTLVCETFSSQDALSNSFKLDNRLSISYYSPNLDFNQIHNFYDRLQGLPSHKPFYHMLQSSLNMLKHPPLHFNLHSLNWLLILLEIPLLTESLINANNPQSPSPISNDLKSLCYDILKRIIGIMAHLDHRCILYLTHWWSKISDKTFVRKVELLNLYITFQLTRCINYEIYDSAVKSNVAQNNDDINYKNTLRTHFIRPTAESSDFGLSIKIPLFISSGGTRLTSVCTMQSLQNSRPVNEHIIKIKLQQYCDEWHLKTAATVISFLFTANKSRQSISGATFYNNLVDYININQDFDSWQFSISNERHEKELSRGIDNSLLMLDYLEAESSSTYLNVTSSDGASFRKPSFTFCQFPFLISLGAKITILEHEARRSMEQKAEQEFIKSLNKKVPFDIYFKIRVRRQYITTDSLRCIKAHATEFKKLLKVEFVNEPGVDAGGLRKEWFLLLTKELFEPSRKLFSYNSTSHLCYFSISPYNNGELYYLVGAVLGLAIYNSTILDLRLPMALYKKLMGRSITLEDYIQLDPETGHGLKKLVETKHTEQMGLYYQVTYKNICGQIKTRPLVEKGDTILVNDKNKYEFVERYMNFFLNVVCKQQFESFCRGFYNVVGGSALSLFTPEEIQKILIGDIGDTRIDTNVMKQITTYNGFHSDDKLVNWFWQYFDRCSMEDQQKILFFVTGSYRLPATGLPALHFKITHLIDDKYDDGCTRLPISHTCFNELCLYDYKTREEFEKKMNMALNYCEGFGLR